MTTSTLKITLPPHPLKVCAFCGASRGSRTKDWNRIADREGTTRGWTCPDCPRYGEPIRRVTTTKGLVRWRFTVTVTPKGSHKAVQRTGTADTLLEARERVKAMRAEMRAAGTFSRPARLTVEDLAQRWLKSKMKDVEAGNLRTVTLVSSYKSALTTALVHMGHREAEEVTIGEVRELLNTLKTKGGKTGKPLGQSSLHKVLLSLRLVFAWGVEQRWLTHNPAASVRVPKSAAKATEQPGPKVWTAAQYETFRDHVDATYASGTVVADREPWVRAGMRLSLCGLRLSEVMGLDWSVVDLTAGRVAVVASRVRTGLGAGTEVGGPKSGDSKRIVPVEVVAPGTKAALRELWLAQGQPAAGLVIRDNLGHPVAPDAFSRRFRALCAAAGVPNLGSIHNLRHTIATALHEAGVAPVEGASLLGHSTATHIGFYVPTSDEAGARAAERAGAIFAPSSASGGGF